MVILGVWAAGKWTSSLLLQWAMETRCREWSTGGVPWDLTVQLHCLPSPYLLVFQDGKCWVLLHMQPPSCAFAISSPPRCTVALQTIIQNNLSFLRLLPATYGHSKEWITGSAYWIFTKTQHINSFLCGCSLRGHPGCTKGKTPPPQRSCSQRDSFPCFLVAWALVNSDIHHP